MVKLAVFDCDGTLVDSQVNIVRAMTDSFRRVGLDDPTSHEVRQVVGLSLYEAMAMILPDADDALRFRLADEYRGAFHRLRAEGELVGEPLYPGVREGLEELARRDWTMGVATGKSDRGLTLVLANHQIAHHFVTLQTADRHPSKPNPSMLHLAMHEAGADSASTAMIGDTVYDIEMAVAAEVRAIGVAWGYHTPDALLSAGAERVVETMPELIAALER